ncbi:VWA domain-containing protein [Candidatus Kaiserbacteria bacterium]|nr:VWA domain-containing protein [Candidatus Kaiserbacteria bacterium]
MRNFPTLFVGFIIALGLAACGDDRPQSQQQQEQVPVASTNWPPAAPADLSVADNPLAENYLVVFDASGSMSSSSCGTNRLPRMETAKKGVIAFAQMLPETANLGLVVGDDYDPKVLVPLGTGNREEFEKQVMKISAGGGTPLDTWMRKGVETLTTQAQMQRGYGTYTLVPVTDGEANVGQDPGYFTKETVSTTAIMVHAIGFCVDESHSLNIQGYTRFSSASDEKELTKGLNSILSESETFQDSQFVK